VTSGARSCFLFSHHKLKCERILSFSFKAKTKSTLATFEVRSFAIQLGKELKRRTHFVLTPDLYLLLILLYHPARRSMQFTATHRLSFDLETANKLDCSHKSHEPTSCVHRDLTNLAELYVIYRILILSSPQPPVNQKTEANNRIKPFFHLFSSTEFITVICACKHESSSEAAYHTNESTVLECKGNGLQTKQLLGCFVGHFNFKFGHFLEVGNLEFCIMLCYVMFFVCLRS
jgi:hypothetical protein